MAVVTSATTNTVSGIKFNGFGDIPNLQIWLDSSDASTFTSSTLFQGQAWIHNRASYVATTTNSSLAFGTGDFTIEFWMYTFDATTTTQRGMFQSSDAIGGLKTSYTSGVVIHQGAGGVTGTIGVNIAGISFNTSPSTISTRFWHHIALVRRSGNATLYIDGVSVATASAPGNCTGTYAALGGYYNTSYLFDGYLSNLRIVSGKAVYTSNFTVPTIPLLAISESGVTTPVLTLQDSTLANNGNVSGINLSTSSGSLSSVVPSDFTRLPYYASTHSAWLYPSIGIDYDRWLYSVASDTFVTNSTLEFWFYPTNTVASDTRILYGGDQAYTAYAPFQLFQRPDLKIWVSVWVGSAQAAVSTNSMTLSSWNHIAFVTYNNNGTKTAKMFLNGVGVNVSVPTQNSIALAREPRGFISPLRVIKNVALYNTDFPPLTAVTFPFSAVSLLSAEITNEPAYITSWRDKSPNAILAFQRDVTRQPTLSSTVYSSLCSLNFNGTRQFLSLSTPVNVQNNYTTFFVYVRPTSSTYSISLANSYPSDTSPYLHWNSNWSYTGDRAYGTYTGTGLLIASLRKNDKLFINLADRGAPVAGWGGTKHSTVDSVGLYYPLSYFHNGLFCEYLQTTLMLPDHEIDMVTKALSAKWK